MPARDEMAFVKVTNMGHGRREECTVTEIDNSGAVGERSERQRTSDKGRRDKVGKVGRYLRYLPTVGLCARTASKSRHVLRSRDRYGSKGSAPNVEMYSGTRE